MDFDLSVEIGRPPAEVFALLADVERFAAGPGSPVVSMEKIPPGRTEVGTRWREVVRLLPGLSMTVWSVVIDLTPDARLVVDFSSVAFTGRLTYELTETTSGTRLHQRQTLEPRGPFRLVSRPMARALRPRLVERLDDIRGQLEAR